MKYKKIVLEHKLNEMEIITKSMITCPHCGHKKVEEMPIEACQYFYECEKCKTMLKPGSGDCCVFCSYGNVSCPPVQEGDNCGKK